MKRKYDEGYALVFALVVLLFLCIVAMSMMQLAGRDMEAQIASVDRMKAQYAAQGELEKIIATVKRATTEEQLHGICTEINDHYDPDRGNATQQTPVTGANEYQMTIHMVIPEAATQRYITTVDCVLKVYKTSVSEHFQVEYNSYAISTVENPNPPAPELENGGGAG